MWNRFSNRFAVKVRWIAGAFFALSVVQQSAADDSKPQPVLPPESVAFFETKVLPLLQARCFECHGPDAKEPKGGLSLASREEVLKGGDSGTALSPGKPGESLLIEAIHYRGFEMPPRSRLPEGEIAILTKWVELGAPWSKNAKPAVVRETEFPLEQRKKEHWAWQPIRSVRAPDVDREGWNRSIIDRFILAKLQEHKLEPAVAADRRTLIRRAYFTLIGLPPTPAQVRAFLADSQPTEKAFEAVVDELLASPHFGERWARHWLDLVRYAETLGHEFDYPLHHAHQYRDYVIRALNEDVPYHQFVREHLAGDLLPNPRLHPTEKYNESLIGTGFWYLGEDKHAPVDARGEEAALIDNRLDVFSKSFLGLTVACARCHDHKFDAISQKDYYALAGFLKSSRRQVGLLDPQGKIDELAKELQLRQLAATTRIAVAAPDPAAWSSGRFSRFLLASRDVVHGDPKPTDAATGPKESRSDIVFEDFEREQWGDKWIAEGLAFEKGPVAGTLPNQQAVTGFEGKRLVNSYVGGDNTIGKLTSKAFVVERKSIRFLIGGGSFAGKTCFNLIIDGKVVRTATGRDNEKLESSGWDVSEFEGELAILQVVDTQKGGWGHVNVDHIVFTDGVAAVANRRPIVAVAVEQKVAVDQLTKWVRSLNGDEVKSPSHPLSTWAALAPSKDIADFARRKAEWSGRLAREAASREMLSDSQVVLDDFNSGEFRNWYVTGNAFGTRPTGARDWDPNAKGLQFAPPGVAHSGVLSPKLTGVLRSRTFTLKHPQILYRVAGKGAQIRLIIDGYQMDVFNGLLFGGASFRVDREDFYWHTQAADVSRYQGHRCYIELIDDGDGWLAVDEIRFANGSPPPAPPAHSLAVKLANDPSISSPMELADAFQVEWKKSLVQWIDTSKKGLENDRLPATEMSWVAWAMSEGLAGKLDFTEELSKWQLEYKADSDSIPPPMRVIAIADGDGEDEWLFIRGSHKNLGPIVPRRMLQAISGHQPRIEKGSGRLELANRLLDPSNPFPSRVMVNRVWHHLFGRGLVPSVDNFGVLGEKPSHPELLDRLADEFMQDGWSVKRLIRRIVLSKSWQMSSVRDEKAEGVDPENRLLHRMNLRRLEGEAIRDSMLMISGRLERNLYGPSVPVHLTPFMQGRGRPGGGPLDGAGRRSIYTSINRNFLSPMMLAFDTPIPFTSIGRRNVSNVPAQALILLNDPFVLEQTKLWAKSVLGQPETSEERVTRLYEAAFSRRPTPDELADAKAFLDEQAKVYGIEGDRAATDERVWADLCHVLVNVKEFIFLN